MEFVKKHLNDITGMWRKNLWSDETKIVLFGLNPQRYIWCNPNAARHTVNTITYSKAGW